MTGLKTLFESNRRWADKIKSSDPEFFLRLSRQQSPDILWIGCSDSRVPANQIVDLPPGEIFVHRNIANLVVPMDLNCLSVIQFAVEVLRIRHIIVCGHYGCGGIRAALDNQGHGMMSNWLQYIKDIYQQHRRRIDAIDDENERINLMCELNVIAQVGNLCQTAPVRHAWAHGQELSVHGWIYSIEDGILHDLDINIDCAVTGMADQQTSAWSAMQSTDESGRH